MRGHMPRTHSKARRRNGFLESRLFADTGTASRLAPSRKYETAPCGAASRARASALRQRSSGPGRGGPGAQNLNRPDGLSKDLNRRERQAGRRCAHRLPKSLRDALDSLSRVPFGRRIPAQRHRAARIRAPLTSCCSQRIAATESRLPGPAYPLTPMGLMQVVLYRGLAD